MRISDLIVEEGGDFSWLAICEVVLSMVRIEDFISRISAKSASGIEHNQRCSRNGKRRRESYLGYLESYIEIRPVRSYMVWGLSLNLPEPFLACAELAFEEGHSFVQTCLNSTGRVDVITQTTNHSLDIDEQTHDIQRYK